jgi:hypothetical protein
VGWEQFAGALQRAIFIVAYVWYAIEALRAQRAPAPPPDARLP